MEKLRTGIRMGVGGRVVNGESTSVSIPSHSVEEEAVYAPKVEEENLVKPNGVLNGVHFRKAQEEEMVEVVATPEDEQVKEPWEEEEEVQVSVPKVRLPQFQARPEPLETGPNPPVQSQEPGKSPATLGGEGTGTGEENLTSLVQRQFSLGLESSRTERDTQYAIAMVNPHIRRLLRHYKDDPFWSSSSKQIIELCLRDSDHYLDPSAVLSQVDGLSIGERDRLVSLGHGYNQITTPADAAVVVKSILFRLKASRLHTFIREYDASRKTEKDIETFLQNVIYISKHYGLAMNVEDFSSVDLDSIVDEGEEKLVILPSFFAPLNGVLGYNGYPTGRLVTVAGAPARGKTTFLLNEIVNFALLGKKVLYFSFADQDRFDLMLKIVAIVSGFNFMKNLEKTGGSSAVREVVEQYYSIVSNPELVKEVGTTFNNPLFDLSPAAIHSRGIRPYLKDPLVQKVLANLYLVVETENRPYVQDIQSTVMSLPEEPDVVVVDYDRYVKARTDEGLYQEGEEIYDGLVSIAKPKSGKKKLVLVASQINKAYWSLPDPPLQSLADSSRKQGISDMVITVGKHLDIPTHEGYISLVKNRIGPTGKFPYILLPTSNILPWRDRPKAESGSKRSRRGSSEVSEE